MGDDRPSSTAISEIALRLLRETAPLGPEGQRRVLEVVVEVMRQQSSRLEAAAAIGRARSFAFDVCVANGQVERPVRATAVAAPARSSAVGVPPVNEDR